MIVELFYHSVAPRLLDRDKDGLHPVVQTHPNQFSHSARMSRAAVKRHFIVDLLIPRKAQPLPDGPERYHRFFLARGHWFNRAATGGQIDTVETVKSKPALQKTRTHEIRLVQIVGLLHFDSWVVHPLRLIAPRATVCQIMPNQNPSNRAQGGKSLYPELFQSPTNGLRPTKHPLVIKLQTNKRDVLFQAGCHPMRTAVRLPRPFNVPVRLATVISTQPFVKPSFRLAQAPPDRTRRLASSIATNRLLSTFLLFLFHWLLSTEVMRSQFSSSLLARYLEGNCTML